MHAQPYSAHYQLSDNIPLHCSNEPKIHSNKPYLSFLVGWDTKLRYATAAHSSA